MNIQRFTAPTAREALFKARMAFGDGTLILSNRPTAHGVEVVATGEDSLSALDHANPRASTAPQASAQRLPSAARANPDSAVLDDANQLAMSTLSFQDYVRERMLRRRQENRLHPADTPSAPAPRPAQTGSALAARPASFTAPSTALATSPQEAPSGPLTITTPAMGSAPQSIVTELQAMKNLIEDRFNALAWLGQARQSPLQSNLMLKLIRCGYSPNLARSVLEHLPGELDAAASVRWVIDALTNNLRSDTDSLPLHEEGGIYALIGATGVGKTTTAAKLAGLCARQYGAASVGLITLDSYRVGAHEQLRAYGRMLGVVAHQAHDRAALQDLLGLLAGKKMVLIDTTGVSPHDPRRSDMLGMLEVQGIKRLMVLNAGGHGDTLEDMVGAFSRGQGQQTVLSKIDEASKIGPALDTAIRHQLMLRGVTTGQKVPEDWERASPARLVALSMRSVNQSAFDPKSADLGFFFAQAGTGSVAGQWHA